MAFLFAVTEINKGGEGENKIENYKKIKEE